MNMFAKLFAWLLGLFGALNADVVLYSGHYCPYCHKVEDYLKENHKTVPTKYIDGNPEVKQELIAIGKKGQIPCLVIDGYPLYGSQEIIEWMKTHPERLQDESEEKATN